MVGRKRERQPFEDGHNLATRLVYSLLTGAVRVAAAHGLTLVEVQRLVRLAYFGELRRLSPRNLEGVAERMGVSLRTVGTLSKQLKTEFFEPEQTVAPMRDLANWLEKGVGDEAELAKAIKRPRKQVANLLSGMQKMGWAEEVDGKWSLTSNYRYYLTEHWERKVDAVNHQLEVVASAVQARFLHGVKEGASGRTWTFRARPAELQQVMDKVVEELRTTIFELDEKAGVDGERVGLTVAFAGLDEED